MSLAQLQHFVVVAEEGHVHRAARRLHISQPPLTRSIRNLESELGAPLFERTPRGMALLPRGEAFLVHARRILAAVDEAIRELEAYDHVADVIATERSFTVATALRGTPMDRTPDCEG